ncbi:hypothetical protein GCM10009809_38330 [Isoptericola hypogeus]|uniref:HTH cro/C1-type domain-containing protein n=2 Tax=Isoptericola hypogeus TaxID=300179 RepID=A0ABN2JV56_9MICO
MKTRPPEVVALGRRVRQAREAQGYSQRFVARHLAERLGQPFAQQQLHRVETGARELAVRELVHLAEVLQVEVGQLLAPAGDAGLFYDVQGADRDVIVYMGRISDDVKHLGEAEGRLSGALDRYAEADPDMNLSVQRTRAQAARSIADTVAAALKDEWAAMAKAERA